LRRGNRDATDKETRGEVNGQNGIRKS